MMNDQDRDLIAALAEGRLGRTAAEDALAHIEADPELASEYADQVAALAFLQLGQQPRMTASERSTLHVNLTEQLGLVPDTTPSPSPARTRTPWWQPVFGLAAAAVVVTAIVVLPGALTGGSADTASLEVAVSEFDADGGEGLQTVTTQSAAATTPVEESASEDSRNLDDTTELSVFETDSVGLDELLKRTRGADSAGAVEEQLSDLTFASTVDLDTAEVERCINDLADDIPDGVVQVRVIGADLRDEETIVHVGFDLGDGIDGGLSFELGSCSLVENAPQG